MSLAAQVLADFDHEMKTTRSLLERVPEERAAWKQHAKSTALGELASHIANLVGWTRYTLQFPELDFHPPGGEPISVPGYKSQRELMERFDRNVREARSALDSAPDEAMAQRWALKLRGATIFSQPRAGVLRGFIMSHLIHHRGQLSVYLRLNDVKLPSIYGPTADT